jgi:uncharacterized membrane protein YfcA
VNIFPPGCWNPSFGWAISLKTRPRTCHYKATLGGTGAGTISSIVIFSSLAGFLGHTAMGHIDVPLLALSALGSIAGALVGAWLMTKKLQSAQVKTVIGVVLYVIAARMLWGLMG